MAQDFKDQCWFTWHHAAFVRAEKMPTLAEFRGDKKKKVQGIDEDAILAGLKRLAKQDENGRR